MTDPACNGELLQDLVARLSDVLRFVFDQQRGDIVILIGDDGVNRALVSQLGETVTLRDAVPQPDVVSGRTRIRRIDEAVLDHQEDGLKLIWIFDNRVRANPVSISTFPTPAEADYVQKGGHFGPHNLHENRPGSFVSSELIFATYQNAGMRA